MGKGVALPFETILPRQGEVAGACQTEGEEGDTLGSVSAPSVACGATSPWRGRIVKVRRGDWGGALPASACPCSPAKAGAQSGSPPSRGNTWLETSASHISHPGEGRGPLGERR